jgi:hypothetical protein
MAEEAIRSQQAEAEQSNQDVMALTQTSGGSTPLGMQPSRYDFLTSDYNPYADSIAAGSPIAPITYDPIFGDYYGLSRFGPAIARDPSGKALVAETVFGNLPFGLGLAARGLMAQGNGIVPDNTFGEFPGDAVNTPSQSEIDDIIARMTPPDTGDDGEPDLGDPQQAAAAVAYVPPVYQTYAGLGLPSVSPIPPLRRVTVPISSFVV